MAQHVVMTTLRTILDFAKLGLAGEIPSGRAKLVDAWKQVMEEVGLEEKVKNPYSSPMQAASGLQHVLTIANANISTASFIPSFTPRGTYQHDSVRDPVSRYGIHNSVETTSCASLARAIDDVLHLGSDGASERQPSSERGVSVSATGVDESGEWTGGQSTHPSSRSRYSL